MMSYMFTVYVTETLTVIIKMALSKDKKA